MTTHQGSQRLAFSPDEAADLLGVSRTLVFELLGNGRLPSVLLGRRRLIPATALTAILETGDGSR